MLGTASWPLRRRRSAPAARSVPAADQGGWRRRAAPVANNVDPNQGLASGVAGPAAAIPQEVRHRISQGPASELSTGLLNTRSGVHFRGSLPSRRERSSWCASIILSSEHNQPGDPFTASLVKPVVVDGSWWRIVVRRCRPRREHKAGTERTSRGN
jgi:hypothetical protein